MTPFLAVLEDQLRDAAEREVASGRRRSLRAGHRRLWSLIRAAPVVVAVGVGILVFVLGMLVLHRGPSHTQSPASTLGTPAGAVLPIGAPVGPTHPLKQAAGGGIEQDTIKVAAQARDLARGLPWGLETFRTTNGQTCMLAGRLQTGRVGVIGEDGTFNNDGRFHPFTRYVLSPLCAQTDANNNAFITVNDITIPASGNDQNLVHSGCRSPVPGARVGPANACRAVDERQLEYGLLGPEAVSVTYRAGGHILRVRTGIGGAFIVVGPRANVKDGGAISDQLMPGMVTAVTYRNGSTCRPQRRVLGARPTPLGCPPVGYLAPTRGRVTSAEVQAPVTATATTAKRWCGSASGFYIRCDARVPAGDHVLRDTAGMVLLQWSWVARVAASGPNAGYEYAIKGGPPCGGGQSSSGPIPARRGQRIVQQSLGGSPCTQRDTISVEYRTNVGPAGPNFASPPNPGHDGQPLVGSTTINVSR
jgi:hypothetical protein